MLGSLNEVLNVPFPYVKENEKNPSFSLWNPDSNKTSSPSPISPASLPPAHDVNHLLLLRRLDSLSSSVLKLFLEKRVGPIFLEHCHKP